LILSSHIKKQIKAEYVKERPKECCGLIVSNKGVLTCVPAKNDSLEKDFFRVNPRDYLQASNLGEIVAVYHSHTNGNQNFSEFDKFNSISHNITYVMYCPENNTLLQFSPSYSEFNTYVGRKFEIGESDCYSLVRSFYEAELKISLGHYYRDQNWRSYLSDLFEKHFEDEGFYEVSSLNKYDCMLFSNSKNKPCSHISLYLGNGMILHQPEKSYSRIESLTGRHLQLIKKVIRHKNVTAN
jgi:proteasome lid subunit RPN8/RPN11